MECTENEMRIAIVTPVYNDGKKLEYLYKSLEQQDWKNFVWIIVNDGSTDDTEKVIKLIKQTASFEVCPIKKENGGKCRAINTAYKKNKEFDFYMIMDSDEEIIEGAIKQMQEKVRQYLYHENVGAIYFWRDMENDPKVQKRYVNRPSGDCIQNIYERKSNDNTYGDGGIGYYQRFLRQYSFKEFEGENFIGEITILLEAALKGFAEDIVYVDFAISRGRYSDNGLSAQGRKLRINNPYGMIYYSGMMQSTKMKNRMINMKYAVSAWAYAWISRISKEDLEKKGLSKKYLKWWAMAPGILVGLFWKFRARILNT